jgi:arginine utilization protein RocB
VPRNVRYVEDLQATLASGNLAFPEQCRIVTERVWATCGLAGPAVITGFGSIPYLPTQLSARPDARRLANVAKLLLPSEQDYFPESRT